MDIREQHQGKWLLYALTDRLDNHTSPMLEAHLISAIDCNNVFVILDMTELNYVSSAGLRILLMGTKKARARGGELVITSLKPHVREVFDISGFSMIFPIYPTAEEAIRTLD